MKMNWQVTSPDILFYSSGSSGFFFRYTRK